MSDTTSGALVEERRIISTMMGAELDDPYSVWCDSPVRVPSSSTNGPRPGGVILNGSWFSAILKTSAVQRSEESTAKDYQGFSVCGVHRCVVIGCCSFL